MTNISVKKRVIVFILSPFYVFARQQFKMETPSNNNCGKSGEKFPKKFIRKNSSMDTPNLDNLDSRIAELLKQLPENHRESIDELFFLLEAEIRKRSKTIMGKEIGFRTLQTTALVNELWLKMLEDTKISSSTSSGFLAILFRKMNQTVVDIARRKMAEKHGGRLDRIVPNEIIGEFDGLPGVGDNPWLLVDLDRAVDKLSREKEHLWKAVFWKKVCGYSGSEVAKMLGISESEVSKRVTEGNIWLRKELGDRA